MVDTSPTPAGGGMKTTVSSSRSSSAGTFQRSRLLKRSRTSENFLTSSNRWSKIQRNYKQHANRSGIKDLVIDSAHAIGPPKCPGKRALIQPQHTNCSAIEELVCGNDLSLAVPQRKCRSSGTRTFKHSLTPSRSCSIALKHETCQSSDRQVISAQQILDRKAIGVQGYLAGKKMPTPLWIPYHPRQRPTTGSQGGSFSYG